jgi:hypothetical protein
MDLASSIGDPQSQVLCRPEGFGWYFKLETARRFGSALCPEKGLELSVGLDLEDAIGPSYGVDSHHAHRKDSV